MVPFSINLPWSIWSVDPQKRNRDAAGNLINEKFHLGKRDAYYRFMGKDWQGRSLAIGNMALRLKYLLEEDNERRKKVLRSDMDLDGAESRKSLATRLLQLRILEVQMELAEIEANLAIARKNDGDNLARLQEKQLDLDNQIAGMKEDLAELAKEPKNPTSISSNILDRVTEWTTTEGRNTAP